MSKWNKVLFAALIVVGAIEIGFMSSAVRFIADLEHIRAECMKPSARTVVWRMQ